MDMLRSTPAMGAGFMALGVSHRPLKRYAGKVMLACVMLVGVATIVFRLSHSLLLSLVALAVPASSHRVGAVNMVFIGASNELDEIDRRHRRTLGPDPRGGARGGGDLGVVALWTLLFPELGREPVEVTGEGLQMTSRAIRTRASS